MYENHYVSVIIAAAGTSVRMGSNINKQFININNKPILAHTIDKFERCKYIDEIIIAAKEDEIDYCRKKIVKRYNFSKVSKIVRGGKERQDSVYNGILALKEEASIIVSHDGARPFVNIRNIIEGIRGAIEYGACAIGVPVKDTIKVIKGHNDIDNTPERKMLWAAQTPQCFKREILMEGYRKAIDDGFMGTDDSSLVERVGATVKMIRGSYENIKITTPEDLIIAESIINQKDIGYERKKIAIQSR